MSALEVIDPGPLSTVQDLGRPGLAGIGVGVSGAADPASLRLANRLVGNAEGAAAIETTFGGFTMRARRELTVAVTGAPCPVSVGGRGGAVDAVLRVGAGEHLRLGPPERGLRGYVAVRGGLDVPRVLGSASTDLLSGVGPEPLSAGRVLSVGLPDRPLPCIGFAPVTPPPADEAVLRIVPGPRDDWFAASALSTLLSAAYDVSSRSNRIGLRLDGPALPRRATDELPSEGMVPGALQVPPSGKPTLFLADHPVTGGYPVIGVVVSRDLPRAAQARPGMRLRFTTS